MDCLSWMALGALDYQILTNMVILSAETLREGSTPDAFQAYPSDLCKELAIRIIRTLGKFYATFTGPTGALTTGASLSRPRITAWSTQASGPSAGITLLNEAVAKAGTRAVSEQTNLQYMYMWMTQ